MPATRPNLRSPNPPPRSRGKTLPSRQEVETEIPPASDLFPEVPAYRTVPDSSNPGTFRQIKIRRKAVTCEDLLEDGQTFGRFLEYLSIGASWTAACASVRLSPDVLSGWMRKGEKAASGPYRRFYLDVHSSLGDATVVAEAQIKRSSPLVWLERGPGKYINPEWAATANGNIQAPTEVNVNVNSGHVPITADAYLAALRELRDAGIDLNTLAMDDATLEARPNLTAPSIINGQARELPTQKNPESSITGTSAPSPAVIPNSIGDEDMDETGEFIYDTADDSEEIDNVGVNYTEDGNWNSKNPFLPMGLRTTDPPTNESGIDPLNPPPDLNSLKPHLKSGLSKPVLRTIPGLTPQGTPDLAAILASGGVETAPRALSLSDRLQRVSRALNVVSPTLGDTLEKAPLSGKSTPKTGIPTPKTKVPGSRVKTPETLVKASESKRKTSKTSGRKHRRK